VAIFLSGESGEDAVVEAEVGMVHVRAFDGSGEFEGKAAEEGYVRVAHRCSFPAFLAGGAPYVAIAIIHCLQQVSEGLFR
jgi:hypothetical protein